MSSKSEPEIIWLTEVQVKILHAEAVSLFGGRQGIRDNGLLQSAPDRPRSQPRNLHAYETDSTVFDLAAAYGFGVAKNHAFIDGNKCVALLAIRAFLFRNGYRFDPEEIETVTVMEGMAAGEVTEELLSDWIQANSRPR